MMPATPARFSPICDRTASRSVQRVGRVRRRLRRSTRSRTAHRPDPNDGCRAPPGRAASVVVRATRASLLLHREGALDAGEVLVDEAAQRRGGVRVRGQPRARRVAQARRSRAAPGRGRRSGTPRSCSCATPRSAAACRSTAARSRRAERPSPGAGTRAPSSARSCSAGRRCRRASPTRRAWPRPSGSTACACAADFAALRGVVGGQRLVDLRGIRRRRPRRARSSSSHAGRCRPRGPRGSISPSRRPRSVAKCCGSRGGAREELHELELAVAARLGGLRELPQPVADLGDASPPRFAGATYGVRGERSWASVVRMVVDSVSRPMLPSTRST